MGKAASEKKRQAQSLSNSDSQPLFFPVSILKLVVMSIVTLGIYEVYWFYKNWKLIQERTNTDIRPFWRGVFLVFYCHPFFKEVRKESAAHFSETETSPLLITVVYIIFKVACKLPEPFYLICYLCPFVLIPIQTEINRLNSSAAPHHDPNTRFTGWNIFGVVVGGIAFVLVVIGSFMKK